MKINNIIKKGSLIAAFAAMFATTSCEPIEDRATLSNSFDKDNIELEVTASTDGGNSLSLQLKTKGITGYWDYILDTKYGDRVDVVFPFTGKHTFTYYVTTPYIIDGSVANTEYVSKTIEVEVKTLDTKLPDSYYALVGDNLEGKSWVFDTSAATWWTMVDPGNPAGVWWNPPADGVMPVDKDGVMTFNLAGGANYIYQASATGEQVTGSTFAFNGDFSRITLSGDAKILGSEQWAAGSNNFKIVELTSDKMVLFSESNQGGTGWLWSFKPQQ